MLKSIQNQKWRVIVCKCDSSYSGQQILINQPVKRNRFLRERATKHAKTRGGRCISLHPPVKELLESPIKTE